MSTYRVDREIGRGGMAVVYAGWHEQLERPVALKVLDGDRGDDEESLQRFLHEARAAARLAHPNIVAVLDRGEQGGRQFIVFEHVEGETLKERVSREGALPIRDVAVDDAVLVGTVERPRDGGADLGDVADRERTLAGDALLERCLLYTSDAADD